MTPGQPWTISFSAGALPTDISLNGAGDRVLRCTVDGSVVTVEASLTNALLPYVPSDDLEGTAIVSTSPDSVDTGTGVVLEVVTRRYDGFTVPVQPEEGPSVASTDRQSPDTTVKGLASSAPARGPDRLNDRRRGP